MGNILEISKDGLFCPNGNFHIDAWNGVSLNLLTHGHADHARWGSKNYLAVDISLGILKHRLGNDAKIETLPYRKKKKIGSVWVSFHPAGHILGSAQIRIEDGSEVTVISGDYKRSPNSSCHPFEVVSCDNFITESTFALPIYHWQTDAQIVSEIYEWWQSNARMNIPSILACYALGKSQHLMAELTAFTKQEVLLHGAIIPFAQAYEAAGIKLVPYQAVIGLNREIKGDLILAPPSALNSPWLKRFPKAKLGCASGWMAVRGIRRRQGYEQGFVLSDHADWCQLLKTIKDTGAKKIYVTHGQVDALTSFLKEKENLYAAPLKGLTQITPEDEVS